MVDEIWSSDMIISSRRLFASRTDNEVVARLAVWSGSRELEGICKGLINTGSRTTMRASEQMLDRQSTLLSGSGRYPGVRQVDEGQIVGCGFGEIRSWSRKSERGRVRRIKGGVLARFVSGSREWKDRLRRSRGHLRAYE